MPVITCLFFIVGNFAVSLWIGKKAEIEKKKAETDKQKTDEQIKREQLHEQALLTVQLKILEGLYEEREWQKIINQYGNFDFGEDENKGEHLQMLAESYISMHMISEGVVFAERAYESAGDDWDTLVFRTAKVLLEQECQKEALKWSDKMDMKWMKEYDFEKFAEVSLLKGNCFFELDLPNEALFWLTPCVENRSGIRRDIFKLYADCHAKIGKKSNILIAREVYKRLLATQYDAELDDRVKKIDSSLQQGQFR